LFIFAVVDFTQIVELLHVPLQSFYTYKAHLGQSQRQHQNLQGETKNYRCSSLQKSMENGHKRAT